KAHYEPYAGGSLLCYILRAKGRLLVLYAVRELPRVRPRRYLLDARIVEIDDEHVIRSEPLDELALGPRHAVEPPELFEVGTADVGDRPDVRTGNLGESF